MAAPQSVIDAYYRRVKRKKITLDDIKDTDIRDAIERRLAEEHLAESD